MDKYDEIILPEIEELEFEEDVIKANQLMMELSDATVPVSMEQWGALIRQSDRLETAIDYIATTDEPEIRIIKLMLRMPGFCQVPCKEEAEAKLAEKGGGDE